MFNNKSFICGFISGEGCFTFYIESQSKNLNIKTVRPNFSITTNINDINLLKFIKEELQVGNVNILKKDFSCAYQVCNINDCLKLVKYFDGNLKGNKLNQFLKWKNGLIKLKKIRNKYKSHHTIYTKEELNYFISIRPRKNKIS